MHRINLPLTGGEPCVCAVIVASPVSGGANTLTGAARKHQHPVYTAATSQPPQLYSETQD